MDSKDNNLIEVKASLFEKIVNNVKSFLFRIFSKKEKQVEEINDNYTENVKKEISIQEKLEKLLKENEELEITLNNKFEELKEIRIKELKITLEIYKIEETYLRKIIMNYNS